ncbi:hypothetical protein [Microbacterium excoecariae]|uniref:hypothetical protein n=1 Tax=Microbacterium excoecariae TaxID=2715210 RepID=UPI00140BFA47|nr:hypothetical protein [Microbacterium excoecariae]NHI15630.1 hypothetical protein [Microbacterium excoecariae]
MRWILAALALGAAATLSGCQGANAGSAAEDAFAAHMAGTPGVTAAGGFLSNDLPFRGSGDLEITLDGAADPAVLEDAVAHTLAFDVPSGVTIRRLEVQLADPGSAEVLIDHAWGAPAGDLVSRAIALAGVAGLDGYAETIDSPTASDPEERTIRVWLGRDDACAALAGAAVAAGVAPAAIEVASPAGLACG